MTQRLQHKTAVVTGAGSGIGRAIAEAFLREGAQAVLVGRHKDRLEAVARDSGASPLVIAADVSRREEIDRVLQQAAAHFRGIHVLVNNAGILHIGNAEQITSATVENLRVCRHLGINTCATMPKPFESFRHWFKCPSCGMRSYKLYRPNPSSGFACRACHNLTYRSAQKHDARLDRLLKMPDGELKKIIEGGSPAWKRLGLRAREIKSGLLKKY